MSDDVQCFDRRSKTYEACWWQGFFDGVHGLMFDLVIEAASALRPRAILDVGCGTGRLLRKAAARWPAAQLIGVDPARGMLEVGKSLMPSGSFSQAFAESLPLGEASVDLVLSSLSMHHWSDASRGVREVARVLRPGGTFCLADILLPPWFSKLMRSKAKSRVVVAELLGHAGFEIRHQRTAFARLVLASVAVKGGP